MSDFDTWFEKYEEDLKVSGRDQTFRKTLELVLERKGRLIAETGCQRMKNDIGGGQSTLILADFCRTFNLHLFSCDIDEKAIELSKQVIQEAGIPPEFVSFIISDSVTFLERFNQTLDLIYLDSRDCPEYDDPESSELLKSQVHQLREIEAVWTKLSKDSPILLDDNGFENGGKCRFTKLFLKDKGWQEILSGKQSLWESPTAPHPTSPL